MTELPPLEIRTLLGDPRPYLRLGPGGQTLRMDWAQVLQPPAARTQIGADGQTVIETIDGALGAFARRAHAQMVALAKAWRKKWK